jgi:2-keto-4-pentenoate hydratase
VILSGALGPMVSVETGTRIVAELSQLGTVSAVFGR